MYTLDLVAFPVGLGSGSAGWVVASGVFMRSWVKGGGVFLLSFRLCGAGFNFLVAACVAGSSLSLPGVRWPLAVCGGLVWRCPMVVGAFPPLLGRVAACSG